MSLHTVIQLLDRPTVREFDPTHPILEHKIPDAPRNSQDKGHDDNDLGHDVKNKIKKII